MSLRKPWPYACAILALLVFAAARLSTAQAPAPAPPSAAPAPTPQTVPQRAAQGTEPYPLFGESIEVRVVNVEVVVTDKKGNRVPGLQAGDFRLVVDGKQRPIQYFTEIHEGGAITPTAGTAGETASVPGVPSLEPGGRVGTSYLVFIDDVFSVAPRRNEVLKGLKASLSQLGPDDRMAIASFDGRHIQMLATWSNSAAMLGPAIDQAMGNRAHGLDRLSELQTFEASQRLVMTTPELGINLMDDHLNLEEIDYASRLTDQLRGVVAAAVSTMRAFASPPGRKVMLLFAGGWPYSPAEYTRNDVTRPLISREVPGGEEIMAPLVETANKIGYTLYPVDVPGLQEQLPDASSDLLDTGAPGTGGGFAATLTTREREDKQTLMNVAAQTGGKALLNSFRLKALAQVKDDTRSYYWLGFTPDWKGNDKSHKVKVEVLRAGLEARARESFLDNSRRSEVGMMVESAMLFGNPAGSSMPIKLGHPEASGRREMVVPVTLAIPVAAFTMVPLNGRYATQLELRIGALDERGRRSDIPVIPIRFSTKEQPAQGRYLAWPMDGPLKVKLRQTPQHLTFAIFDPLSNKITTAEADVKP